MKKIVFPFILILCTAIGCYYDKKDDIYPAGDIFTPCDTTQNVSYSQHILPILKNYCYSCHSGTNPSSGYNLENWSDVNHWALNNNVLLGSIYHQSGFNAMPGNNFQLDSCRMNQFSLWVNAGALNN